MNIFLNVLQVMLTLQLGFDGIQKFSNFELIQFAIPSMSVFSHGVWIALATLQVICSLGLALSVFVKKLKRIAPIAAAGIVLEMLILSVVHLTSDEPTVGPTIIWILTATFCAMIAYFRGKKAS